AEGVALLVAAEDAAAGTAALLGSPVRDDVAWPARGRADERTAELVAGDGEDALVVDGASLPADADLTYTPTGRATLTTGSGELAALVADDELSAALEDTGAQGVAGVQRFLAEAATITLERPYDTRGLLAVAPRGWNPEPSAVAALLAALEDTPWVQLQPLSALRATAAPDGAGAQLAGGASPGTS
ncbi:DUF6049 family protein, partial [Kineococcus glutinatus]|uniref:DUF6049 family protein n=1 Tax=Kineococcus glutinatus TaxID=1070872 RepID=UPI0031EA4E50